MAFTGAMCCNDNQSKIRRLRDRSSTTSITENCRVVLNNSDDKIGAKIRQARLQRVPYMLIIGEREQENRTVSVRSRDEGDIGAMSLDGFVDRISREVDLDF